MNSVKKYLGIVWIFIAVCAILILIIAAAKNINLQGKLDINKPMPWIIIITIFTPIAIGLGLFGWYCYKNEYKKV